MNKPVSFSELWREFSDPEGMNGVADPDATKSLDSEGLQSTAGAFFSWAARSYMINSGIFISFGPIKTRN